MTVESRNNRFQCWKCRQDGEIEFKHVICTDGKKIQFCQSKCYQVFVAVMNLKAVAQNKKEAHLITLTLKSNG